jgi:hypothetical protein
MPKRNEPNSLGRKRPAHISQITAGSVIGVGSKTFSLYESEPYDPAKIAIGDLEKLADFYGCTVSDLLGRTMHV